MVKVLEGVQQSSFEFLMEYQRYDVYAKTIIYQIQLHIMNEE